MRLFRRDGQSLTAFSLSSGFRSFRVTAGLRASIWRSSAHTDQEICCRCQWHTSFVSTCCSTARLSGSTLSQPKTTAPGSALSASAALRAPDYPVSLDSSPGSGRASAPAVGRRRWWERKTPCASHPFSGSTTSPSGCRLSAAGGPLGPFGCPSGTHTKDTDGGVFYRPPQVPRVLPLLG